MKTGSVPLVTVGLTIYNGEDYIEEAIESILGQTLSSFELIISDNASTDRTEEICRRYASKDDRICYIRRPSNIGGARNMNFVVELARGRYFKWAAHDDVCRPDFLLRCVEVLERDPAVVLAYPRPLDIDEGGVVIGPRDAGLQVTSASPYLRFKALMTQGHAGLIQYGVVRTEVLRETALIGSYEGSDRPLLGELALHGPLVELDEELFLHREHRQRSTYVHGGGHGSLGFYDPGRVGSIAFPMWRRLGGYLGAILRAPIGPVDRLRCVLLMARWAKGMRARLQLDLRLAWRATAGRVRRRLPGRP